MFNFLRLLPIGDTTKCRNPTMAKIGVFRPLEGDRIKRSRQNLAGKRTPWVCYSIPHLALIGKRGSYRTPKVKICPKLCFGPPEADTMNTFTLSLACKCRPWVWSSTPNLTLIGKRRSVQEPPKVQICPKLWFLATGSRHN